MLLLMTVLELSVLRPLLTRLIHVQKHDRVMSLLLACYIHGQRLQ